MFFEKHFISYSCIFISYIQALRYVFKNSGYFSKKEFFQIFDWSIVFFDQSKFLLKILVSLCLVRLIEPVQTQFWLVQTSFQNFSKIFSLSSTRQGSTEIFCCFPPKFLQNFSLPKPVCLFYPSFCIVFLIFMHNLMVFGYFLNYA